MRRNPGKALRVRAEGREFESRRPRIGQFVDPRRAFFGIDRRIERKIDARLRTRFLRLGSKSVGRGNQAVIVIGHVDDGGDAAGRGAARRPDEILLSELAAAVNLGVDRAGKYQNPRAAVFFARWRTARPDRLHHAVADQNVTVFDDPIGQNDSAAESLVSHYHLFVVSRATPPVRRRAIMPPHTAAQNVR